MKTVRSCIKTRTLLEFTSITIVEMEKDFNVHIVITKEKENLPLRDIWQQSMIYFKEQTFCIEY